MRIFTPAPRDVPAAGCRGRKGLRTRGSALEAAQSCASIASAPETSYFPGASILTFLTTPSSTSSE